MSLKHKIKHIFLVDDEVITLNLGRAVLQQKYIVTPLQSGEKLLSLLEDVKPDLILLDVIMPGMCGYDAIREIKANSRVSDIPVVFLSGKSEAESELLGLSLGAVDYIKKPFSPKLLLKRLEMHLSPIARKWLST